MGNYSYLFQSMLYPTGQKLLLDLMFAKFATAKNREKLNPLKVPTDAICLKMTLKMCKSAPPLGLELLTFGSYVQFQIRHSMTELQSQLCLYLKNTKVVREPFIQ